MLFSRATRRDWSQVTRRVRYPKVDAPSARPLVTRVSADARLARMAPEVVFFLQRSAGNAAVADLLQRCGGGSLCAAGAGVRQKQEAAGRLVQRQREVEGLASASQAAQPVLRLGARGAAVVALQQALNGAGAMPPLRADGDFGPATVRATRDFQTGARLTPDGVVGSATWAALASRGVAGGPAVGPKRGYDGILTRVRAIRTGLGLLQAKEGTPAAGASAVGREPTQPEIREASVGEDGSILDTVVEGVESFVEDPVGYAEQKVSEAASAVESFVSGTIDTVQQAVETAAGKAREFAEDPAGYAERRVDELTAAAGAVADDLSQIPQTLRERYPGLIGGIDEALKTLGRPLGLDPEEVERGLDGLLDWLRKAVDESPEQIRFNDGCQEGYTEVRVENKTITVRGNTVEDAIEDASRLFGGHAGQVLPKLGPRFFCPEDESMKVRSASLYVTEEVTLPVWAERSKFPEGAQKRWDRFLAALGGHEERHVAIDQRLFEPMHQACIGKSQNDAIDAINDVVTQGEAENAKLDAKEGRIKLNSSGEVTLVPR